MSTWQRLFLRSAGFGAGFAVVVCGIIGVLSYQRHRTASQAPAYREVSVKASDWPLHATKVCFFFGTESDAPIVGCWDDEDVGGQTSNRNDAAQDHLFLVDVTLSRETKKALTEGHNRKLYCVRDDYKLLTCGGNGL